MVKIGSLINYMSLHCKMITIQLIMTIIEFMLYLIRNLKIYDSSTIGQ